AGPTSMGSWRGANAASLARSRSFATTSSARCSSSGFDRSWRWTPRWSPSAHDQGVGDGDVGDGKVVGARRARPPLLSLGGGEWLWVEDRMDDLLGSDDDRTLFVQGCVRNRSTFYDRFDAVVLLSAPEGVILDRIARRATNDYGK